MAPKKATKSSTVKAVVVENDVVIAKKIQTAEGWRRMMARRREAKGKKGVAKTASK